MGIDVRLEDERGRLRAAVPDPHGRLAVLLAGAVDCGPVCLRFIDPYGDTTFNRHQMATLVPELEAAVRGARDAASAEHGLAVLRLSRSCRDGVHLYLKFVGD